MARPWHRGSLRIRFLIIFGALTILPLAAVALALGERNAGNLEVQSVELQQEAASSVAARVASILEAREHDLWLLDVVVGIGDLEINGQEALLRQLLSTEAMYQELALLDAGGRESIRLADGSVVPDADLTDRSDEPAFRLAAAHAIPEFGPVVFDEELREPLTSLAYPIIDRRTDRVESVILATVSLRPIWELLGSLTGDGTRDVYIIDADGRVVAHGDPPVVLRNTTVELPETAGRAAGMGGRDAVLATHTVMVGSTELTVVAEEPAAIALAPATRAVQLAFVHTLLTLVAVAGALVMVTHRVVRPIEEVAESARRVASGDRSHLVAAKGNDEVTELAVAFNQMTLQLDDLIETLEHRVAERTREIEEGNLRQAELIIELEGKNAELIEAREQLEGLIRSKDQFVGAVSHELRTPLTSVLGFASLIREGREVMDDAEQVEMIDRVVVQAQDMADIINDLLTAARLDGGSLTVEPVPVDVHEAVRSVIGNLPEVDADIDGSGEVVTALADPVRVRQILRNLVVNAARYGGDDVCVSIDREDSTAVVEVRDGGDGVPEDQWELIFDPYRRARNHAGNPASAGLGLSVSRSLARRMGGDLAYRYESGTSIFALELPVYAEPGAASG